MATHNGQWKFGQHITIFMQDTRFYHHMNIRSDRAAGHREDRRHEACLVDTQAAARRELPFRLGGQTQVGGGALLPRKAGRLSGRDALAVHHIARPIEDSLTAQGMAELYHAVENPLVRVLARMEHVGVGVDRSVLEAAGIDDAGAILITTHDDNVNVYLTRYCRGLRPDARIVSRSKLDRNVSTLYRAGADAVLVAGDDQLDQWFVRHPGELVSRPSEQAIIKSDNADPIDIGKDIWYHSFDLFTPDYSAQGAILNQPAVDRETGEFFPMEWPADSARQFLLELSVARREFLDKTVKLDS